MIPPTISRKVWYAPTAHDLKYHPQAGEQPFDATIVYVWDDHTVNLAIRDHAGDAFTRARIQLLQDSEAPNPKGGYAMWMPYQKSVASGAQAPTLHAHPSLAEGS